MSDPRHPAVLPDGDDDDFDHSGYWISPGAARRFRRLSLFLGIVIVLQGFNAFNAWDARRQAVDARDDLQAEVQARVTANTANAHALCEALNDVARASKGVVVGTGATLTQGDVARVSDPQLQALLQLIVSRSAENQQNLRDLGDKIPILDCDAQARRAR